MTRRAHLKQDATKWTATADGFGGWAFTAPVALKVRWEEKAVLFRDQSGEEVISSAKVFLDVDVEINDWLFLGTSTDADPTAIPPATGVAYQVRMFEKLPSLRNLEYQRIAFL